MFLLVSGDARRRATILIWERAAVSLQAARGNTIDSREPRYPVFTRYFAGLPGEPVTLQPFGVVGAESGKNLCIRSVKARKS